MIKSDKKKKAIAKSWFSLNRDSPWLHSQQYESLTFWFLTSRVK